MEQRIDENNDDSEYKGCKTRLSMTDVQLKNTMQFTMTKTKTHEQGLLLAYANEIKGVEGMLHAMGQTGYTKEAHQWDEHNTTYVKHMGLSGIMTQCNNGCMRCDASNAT